MCGITAVINKNNIPTQFLVQANSIVAHRGPDDEGFLLWNPETGLRVFSGNDTATPSIQQHHLTNVSTVTTNWKVGLGHRRLSILDLSPAGHQPMPDEQRFALTYNGEVFNYLEIQEELKALGHVFNSSSDTEVILKAWKQWGAESLHKFNGMFAFVLLDTQAQKMYAVRDRFGVKPLYHTSTDSYTAFASEAKQLRILPEYRFELNKQVAYDYLRFSLLDYNQETFENNILQLSPGHYMEVDLLTGTETIHQWYTLNPPEWKGSEEEAISQFKALLKDSVRIRMRSDVSVGSALSGGLDSSTLVSLMREVLEEQEIPNHPIQTISSCSEDKRYDEFEYAESIIKKFNALPSKVFPSFEKLLQDIDRLIWHMDYPFGSTSQFSQWCVFEEARKRKLTVMINGQGADEQLAGYGGNDMSLYIGLMSNGRWMELWREAWAYKRYNGKWPFAFVVGALQHKLPKKWMDKIPDRFRVFKQYAPVWLKSDGMKQQLFWPDGLKESLIRQVTQDPLPSLLRYEDRNSMAFSIESRVPFMDHRLVEFTLGLPEHMVYRRGERKVILRKAFRGRLPDKIIDRRDKMGFVSAEERWLKEEGKKWFEEKVIQASKDNSNTIDEKEAIAYLQDMQVGAVPFNFDPWRILCFDLWLKSVLKQSQDTLKRTAS